MNKTAIVLASLISISAFLSSCSESKPKELRKVANSGKVVVENGKGGKDTIEFTCTGCAEYAQDTALFDNIVKEATTRTKNSLKIPLSFVPKKLELTVLKQDSLFDVDNKKVDGVCAVLAKYSYIGKNAMGTEMEGNSEDAFYTQNTRILDDIIVNSFRLDKLVLKADGFFNRHLKVSNDDRYIVFKQLPDKDFVVHCNISCIDDRSLFLIILENEEKIELYSYNDFNCESNAYFRKFTQAQIDKLKASKIKAIALATDDETTSVQVPENQRDYFMQMIAINESKK